MMNLNYRLNFVYAKKIEKFINNVITEEDMINMWNDYCRENSDYEHIIYEMNDYNINEVIGEYTSPAEVINSINFNKFNINDDYFIYSIYGLESSQYASNFIYLSDLARYMWDNEDPMQNDDIEECLEELLEEFETVSDAAENALQIAGYRERDILENLTDVKLKQYTGEHTVYTFYSGSNSFDYDLKTKKITG